MFNRFFMFMFLIVFLGAIAISAKSYIDRVRTVKAVGDSLLIVENLTKKIEELRSSRIQFNRESFDLQEFKPPAVEEIRLELNGIVQIKFQDSLKGIGGRWVFFVPAIRGYGQSFSYFDFSKKEYDTTSPLFWICGVVQYNMPDRKYLPQNCQYILGPEYNIPY